MSEETFKEEFERHDKTIKNPDVSESAELAGYMPTNREKSMKADKSKHWCDCCDANHVGDIGKCSVCGNISQPHKRKGM